MLLFLNHAILVTGVASNDKHYTEATLRCLSTIFQSPNAPVSLIFVDPLCVPCLLSLTTQSVACQVCVPAILAAAIKVCFISLGDTGLQGLQ